METTDRLREDLITTGSFGRPTQTRIDKYELLERHCGVTRPTGSEGNRKICDYAVDRMKEAGLTVRIDRVGNIMLDSFEMMRTAIEADGTRDSMGLAPNGYGTNVRIRVGSANQYFRINGGSNYLGRSQLIAHFGTRKATVLDGKLA